MIARRYVFCPFGKHGWMMKCSLYICMIKYGLDSCSQIPDFQLNIHHKILLYYVNEGGDRG